MTFHCEVNLRQHAAECNGVPTTAMPPPPPPRPVCSATTAAQPHSVWLAKDFDTANKVPLMSLCCGGGGIDAGFDALFAADSASTSASASGVEPSAAVRVEFETKWAVDVEEAVLHTMRKNFAGVHAYAEELSVFLQKCKEGKRGFPTAADGPCIITAGLPCPGLQNRFATAEKVARARTPFVLSRSFEALSDFIPEF